MKLISHRGNLNGPSSEIENTPAQIIKVCDLGFDCEIDVWYENGFYLGHDFPNYPISEKFLENNRLWCHAKNLAALNRMISNKKIHCFWHENDLCSITSGGYIWSFPTVIPSNNSTIFVDLRPDWKSKNYSCVGICSDYLMP